MTTMNGGLFGVCVQGWAIVEGWGLGDWSHPERLSLEPAYFFGPI